MTDDSHAPQQTTKKVEKTAAKDEKQPVEEKKETAQAKPVAAKTVAPKKQEVKTSDADEPSPKGGGVMGGMTQGISDMKAVLADPEKRKHFMSHEDMEPHRHLIMLLGVTILITIIVALVF